MCEYCQFEFNCSSLTYWWNGVGFKSYFDLWYDANGMYSITHIYLCDFVYCWYHVHSTSARFLIGAYGEIARVNSQKHQKYLHLSKMRSFVRSIDTFAMVQLVINAMVNILHCILYLIHFSSPPAEQFTI